MDSGSTLEVRQRRNPPTANRAPYHVQPSHRLHTSTSTSTGAGTWKFACGRVRKRGFELNVGENHGLRDPPWTCRKSRIDSTHS